MVDEKDKNAYQRLISIGLALSAEKEINSLLDRILREAKSLANADAGSLYLKENEDCLRFAIVLNDSLGIVQGGISGEPVTLPDIALKTPEGEHNLANIATRAAISGKTLVVDDAYTSDEFDFSGARQFDELTGYQSISFLTIPLKTLAGETMGVLQLLNARNECGEVIPFSSEVRPLIEALGSLASVAMENRLLLDEQEALKKQLESEVDNRTRELSDALTKLSEAHDILKEMTTIDAVTGIRNRQYFDEVFEQEWRRALRQQYDISLLILDIDHFKRVNDTFGHLAGDECLATVAREIDGMINRPSDVVARYGGEEFVVILPYISGDKARQLAEQVRADIDSRMFMVEGQPVHVTVSVGVSSMVPGEPDRSRELISRADEALYCAKSTGRNRVCVYGD